MQRFVHKVAAARPDVLFVSAYLDDAIALRRQLVAQHVPLLANIGTSSSYCMPAFGATLGKEAVGVYASDKPSASAINPAGLRPEGRALLERANAAYYARYDTDMSPAALAGFSGAWALFTDVLPASPSLDPAAVADTARTVDLPRGSLPNGSGLRFGALGTPEAGDNVAAASVIWEWVSPGHAAVIWPPAFATQPMDPSAVGRVVRRRALAGSALGVIVAYAALAAWSGRLSPLARGPLLDGLGPPQAYRWVSPPPDLAATNVAPSNLTGSMPLTPKGVLGASFVSSDSQITVIVKDGAIAPHGHDTSVALEATPVDPATLAPLGGDLEPFGNAYRIAFTYLPSKTRVTQLRDPLDVLLVYPVHGDAARRPTRALRLAGREGLDPLDVPRPPRCLPGRGAGPGARLRGGGRRPDARAGEHLADRRRSGTNAVATGLFVVAGVALLVGIGLVLRGRKRG